MCLKAENQWLDCCSPYSGAVAPGTRPAQGLERWALRHSPVHTPLHGSKDRGKDDIHPACTSVGTGIHICRCVCLSVFLCLSGSLCFHALCCSDFGHQLPPDANLCNSCNLQARLPKPYGRGRKTSPSLSFLSLSNAIWVEEASKLCSKGLGKHSGFFWHLVLSHPYCCHPRSCP